MHTESALIFELSASASICSHSEASLGTLEPLLDKKWFCAYVVVGVEKAKGTCWKSATSATDDLAVLQQHFNSLAHAPILECERESLKVDVISNVFSTHRN
jgi:hypothetical protein